MNTITTIYDCDITGERIVDSRFVIEAIDFLRGYTPEGEAETRSHRVLLEMLSELAEQGETMPDWQYGATLVDDRYFVDYARELAEDCGMINDAATWPYTCIDWEQAARELQGDYTPIEYGRRTYWVR